MGGHGGLNILPQKSWHVYNYEAREKVRRDEEAHAAEEQKQRDRQLQTEGELRRSKLLEKAKKRRRSEDDDVVEGATTPSDDPSTAASEGRALQTTEPVKHINLFEAVVLPDIVGKGKTSGRGGVGSLKAEAEGAAEDAKHRLGYGCVSGVDGVTKPWYLEKAGLAKQAWAEKGKRESVSTPVSLKGTVEPPAKKGKKSIEELRAERLQRENGEKERQRRLMLGGGAARPQAQAASQTAAAGGGAKQRYNTAFGYGR